MSDENGIRVGDTVVVLNVYGLRVEGKVVAISEEHGTQMYRIASESFSLTVTRKQIVEVHR
jgi:hypothetical protein